MACIMFLLILILGYHIINKSPYNANMDGLTLYNVNLISWKKVKSQIEKLYTILLLYPTNSIWYFMGMTVTCKYGHMTTQSYYGAGFPYIGYNRPRLRFDGSHMI